jgi:hypothetical protein
MERKLDGVQASAEVAVAELIAQVGHTGYQAAIKPGQPGPRAGLGGGWCSGAVRVAEMAAGRPRVVT